ncbi:MAG TPA: TIGR04053 family radical SAM/SPASM domain-containing protein [Vicinamibacteria bacterium]|nr:TIGR04053 family radical SAM/SPASM domain-containing protein [Vicinamibacteria bacterium]
MRHPGAAPPFVIPDFERAPLLVIWETTQACGLACRHCRASARPWRDPGELSTEEGLGLVDAVADMGTPLMVLSGGDPLNRPDLARFVAYGKARGLRMATIPAATEQLTYERLAELKAAGLDQVAFSLDFPRADLHDDFRCVPGAFERTIQAAGWARRLGLPLQINTTVCGETAPYLEEMAEFVATLGIVFWEVFFLVPMGRGALLRGLRADDCERLFEVLWRAESKGQFVLKVTEAPQYRRWVAQHGGRRESGNGRPAVVHAPIGLSPKAVNSGKGFLFVSHTGDIYPSGFLPLPVGNVRDGALAQAYRRSQVFRDLRDPDWLKGRCGRCEFRATCGGSRARAFAITGDAAATDPWCAYRPAAAEARSAAWSA